MRFLTSLFLDDKSAVFLFTCALSELLAGKIPLAKAMEILAGIDGTRGKVRSAAAEISESLAMGSSFYVALRRVSCIKFPDWYLSFAGCTEKTGNLPEVFEMLGKIIKKQEDDRHRLFSALAYPIFVAAASLAFGILAFNFSGEFMAAFGREKSAEKQILSSFFPAVSFLLLSYGSLFILTNKIFAGSAEILVFKSLSFMAGNSVPVLEALDSCFPFAEKDRKIEAALLSAIERVKRGEMVSEAFSKSFFESGLKSESHILDFNLSICEASGKNSGKNDGFLRTAEILEKKRNSRIESFISMLQPALMFITAVFLWLLIKELFLPVFSGFGGDF